MHCFGRVRRSTVRHAHGFAGVAGAGEGGPALLPDQVVG